MRNAELSRIGSRYTVPEHLQSEFCNDGLTPRWGITVVAHPWFTYWEMADPFPELSAHSLLVLCTRTGDLNCDGIVDATDYEWAGNLEGLEGIQVLVADLNQDGVYTESDKDLVIAALAPTTVGRVREFSVFATSAVTWIGDDSLAETITYRAMDSTSRNGFTIGFPDSCATGKRVCLVFPTAVTTLTLDGRSYDENGALILPRWTGLPVSYNGATGLATIAVPAQTAFEFVFSGNDPITHQPLWTRIR